MPWTKASRDEIEALYRQHGAALLLFAVAIAGEHGRAQDAVHQVFLRLIESGDLGSVRDRKAYLFACVRNALLNEGKTLQRHAPLESDSAWFDPPERDYAQEQNLRCAITALPDDQRQAVVLHIWGELTFSQIAEITGVNSNTAASRYRYGLAKLREALCAKEEIRGNSRG